MSRILIGSIQLLTVGVVALAFTTAATAQMHMAARPMWNSHMTAQMMAPNRMGGFYGQNPYANMMRAYPSNAWGGYGNGYGGGYGGSYGGGYMVPNSYGSQSATPYNTNQTAAYPPARQQAYYSGTLLNKSAYDAGYEKTNPSSSETVREELRQQRLTRARNTPTALEIASGDALNELLTNIQRIQGRQTIVGNSIQVDPETIAHLNVTNTDDHRGSNELFKPGAFLIWPSLLEGEKFATDRKVVVTMIVDAAQGKVVRAANDAGSIEARRAVERMKTKLFECRFKASFTNYANALTFLDKLMNAVNTLAKQDAVTSLNGVYAAKGNTVSQLVEHMNMHGLKFAKATSGDEPYYATIYQSIVAYEIDLSQRAERQAASNLNK